MSEQNKNELSFSAEKVLHELEENGDFEIKPCNVTNIEDNPKYKKLSLYKRNEVVYNICNFIETKGDK